MKHINNKQINKQTNLLIKKEHKTTNKQWIDNNRTRNNKRRNLQILNQHEHKQTKNNKQKNHIFYLMCYTLSINLDLMVNLLLVSDTKIMHGEIERQTDRPT